ncbi:MAG: hypothetical protein IAG13_34680 [Deltaproteobacteria bacterium]|nr:hypothetical protein [Nannocystaceae bacterium]
MPARTAAAPRIVFLSSLLLACELAAPSYESPSSRTPVRIPEPVLPAEDLSSADLLQEYAPRPPLNPRILDACELTYQQKMIAIALLSTAANDRLDELDLVLTPDATWGMPDPRRFGQRPVFADDGGAAFLAAFRQAARRFPAKSGYHTEALPGGPQAAVGSGAEPYWTYWVNERDRIYMRMVIYRGRPYIDYVGFFETVPDAPLRVLDRVVPPLAPPLRRPPPGTEETSPLPPRELMPRPVP